MELPKIYRYNLEYLKIKQEHYCYPFLDPRKKKENTKKNQFRRNLKKKRAQNNVVLNGIVLFLPLDTQQGKKRFCSPAFSRSPSLLKPKKPTRPTPHLMPCHWGKNAEGASPTVALGRLPSGCQPPPTPVSWLDMGSRSLSLFFPINTSGEKGKEGGGFEKEETGEERDKKTERGDCFEKQRWTRREKRGDEQRGKDLSWWNNKGKNRKET